MISKFEFHDVLFLPSRTSAFTIFDMNYVRGYDFEGAICLQAVSKMSKSTNTSCK